MCKHFLLVLLKIFVFLQSVVMYIWKRCIQFTLTADAKPIDQQTTARTGANILACFLCVGHVVDTSAGDKSVRTQDPAFWIENAGAEENKGH